MNREDLFYPNRTGRKGTRCLSSGIRYWHFKKIEAGPKVLLKIYPAAVNTAKTRRKLNHVSRESQIKWNNESRKEHCRLLIYQNFKAGDLYITLTFKDPPANESELQNKIKYFLKKLRSISSKPFKYLGCIEVSNTDGEPVRVHLHLLFSGILADEIKKAWIYGHVNHKDIRSSNFERISTYITKNFLLTGDKKHRYIRSRNLSLYKVQIDKIDIARLDEAEEIEAVTEYPAEYCSEFYPDFFFEEEPHFYSSPYLLNGFYMKINLHKKIPK